LKYLTRCHNIAATPSSTITLLTLVLEAYERVPSAPK
jgi:hypothetical protein